MTASDAHFTFPSPVGELHFSMQLKRSLMIILGFRPLSGNYISQSVFMDLDRIARGRVSVPCRGTTFLNMVQITLSLMKHTEFPSPVGELHFSIFHTLWIGVWMHEGFRPLSGNYISQYHPCNPATSLGSWSGLRGKNIFGKINKMHLLKSAANSVFKPCAAKSKQIFSFIKKYQFHIVPSYILFPDSGYISRYVVKPSFLYLYSAYDFVAHLFCQRYLLLFQYLLFRQT